MAPIKKNYGVSPPRSLVRNALRAAQRLGFKDEMVRLQKRWGGRVPTPLPRGAGEVIVLHYNGLPPHKVDRFFEIGFAAGWAYVEASEPEGQDEEKVEQARSIARSILADDVVRVAFPKYVRTPYRIQRMTVQAESARKSHAAELAEDIGAIAIKNLKDRIGRIRAKTIARAVIKFALSRKLTAKVGEKQGEGAAWLAKKILQVASSATEFSDKRSWQTLPDKIWMSQIVLPSGSHTLHLVFQDAQGNVVSRKTLEGVLVQKGKKTIVVARTAQ